MIWELATALVGYALVAWGYAPLWRPVAPSGRWRASRVDMVERQVLDDEVTLPVTAEEMDPRLRVLEPVEERRRRAVQCE